MATLVALVQVATELGRAAIANGHDSPGLVRVAAMDRKLSKNFSQFKSHLI